MQEIPKNIKKILAIEIIFIGVLLPLNITLYFLNIGESIFQQCYLSFNAIERCYDSTHQLIYKQRITKEQCEGCDVLVWLLPSNVIMLVLLVILLFNRVQYYLKMKIDISKHFLEIIYFGLQFFYNLFVACYLFQLPINQNYKTKQAPLILLIVESLVSGSICLLIKVDQMLILQFQRDEEKKEKELENALLL